MDLSKSVFGTAATQEIRIPETTQVIFVSDMFAEDYAGGAELTSEALIRSSPFDVFKLHSKDVTMRLLEQGHKSFWIFGNFSRMDLKLIPTIAANMRYAVLEYDFKYCRYRSPEKHMNAERKPCDCHNEMHGKMVSAFYHAAKSLWWMSEKQQARYHEMFPFLAEKPNCVLSSVFDDETFAMIKKLREKRERCVKDTLGPWVILGSPSWIKGMPEAEKWCKDNGKEYELVWGLSHTDLLKKLAAAEGHVYLPQGADTCPRMVIEARLIGCELHLNDFVQHRYEEWFDTDDTLLTESYLYAARERFWNGIKHDYEYNPTLSGYTTTRNCISQKYPFEATIRSMLGFCDEVCIVDGGSTDGTWERLRELSDQEERLKVWRIERDYDDPRFALFDGLLKREARLLCTGDFCWQMDSDEVVHESDHKKIRSLMQEWPPNCVMLSLPLIEYWGGKDKVRCDILPWKWRISRNLPTITHGVPKSQRLYDDKGKMYSAGSDGCDPIHSKTGDPVPFLTFYTPDVDALRRHAAEDERARSEYEEWYQNLIENLPTVRHFSWWNIERKIHTYRDYWQGHWNSIYNKQLEDTPENNMFFSKRWADVTEKEIDELAHRLKCEMGGWIFHSRVDFTKPTASVTIKDELPEAVKEWAEENAQAE